MIKQCVENKTGCSSSWSYKPDWARSQARWDAFWAMEATDRPCMSVRAPHPNGKKIQLPELKTVEDKWMNAEYQLAKALKPLEENYLGGEAPPCSGHFMAGTTTGCDGHLQFHENCIDITPSMTSIDQPLSWHPGPQDPWRPRVDAICNRLLDDAPGRYIVSPPGQYPHLDLLNMLRGNENMLLDLAMYPEQCKARLLEMRGPAEENANHFRQLIGARQGDAGYITWTGVWCRQLFRATQADCAANISPEMFAEIILPELDFLGERYERLWYHTCGYKQHLDLCLSRPYMRVIQYSPNPKEPGNGPAHLEFYQRVQKAGRCLDIGVSAAHVEFLVRHLRPEGLHISTHANSVAEAEELLEKAVKWCGNDIHRSGQ